MHICYYLEALSEFMKANFLPITKFINLLAYLFAMLHV